MGYAVKELYRTLQGEGAHAGRAAVFCRFAGCNLGYEVCPWCDTDWLGTDGPGGGVYASAAELVQQVAAVWGPERRRRFVVLTGGEPMLQVDIALIYALHNEEFAVAIETNGTRPVPTCLDWITVSPKAGSAVVQRTGQELKLVFPQPGLDPAGFLGWPFRHFYLQPLDGPDREAHTQAAIAYCLAHPEWTLGLQVHKLIGLP
jgi:7-carboxy-7-deazaguanine synthase